MRVARRPGLLAGFLWLLVALGTPLTGKPFDATSFKQLYQLVPFDALQANPFSSVWNTHIQPPLWNLTLGVVGRWTPLPFGLSMQLLMAAFGFAGAALLCDTLHRIGVRARWAVPLTLFVMCEPDVLINAFEPRYELPITTGLIAIAWIIVRANESAARDRWLLWLSVAATAVVMTRTLYHPVWLVILVGGFAWRWRSALNPRWIGVAAAIPLVLVGGWLLKNKVLFGHFTLDTWSGMNLQRAVIPLVHADDKQAMLQSGDLSQVSAAGPFADYDKYIPAVGPCTEQWDSPVLSRLTKDGGGTNFNAGCFLRVYDLARDDAITAIREHPDAYIEGRLWSARRWFALDEEFDKSDSKPLRALVTAYRVTEVAVPGMVVVSNWGTPIFGTGDVINHFSLLNVACSIAVVGAAFNRRSKERDLWLYLAFVTSWTFASGVLFELGEQPRFRSMTDPLVLAFGIVALVRAGAALRARRHDHVPGGQAVGSNEPEMA